MSFVFRTIILSCVLLFGCLLYAEERPAPFSLSVGTQSIGVRYQFSDESALVESAEQILALGSDTLKIAFTPKYADDYRLEIDPAIRSINDLVAVELDYFRVMDKPFRNIMLWIYPFSDSMSAFATGEISESEAEAVYEEIYTFTVNLLERYSGSGKSFFLGNWEGDWHLLLENYDYNLDPTPEAIEGAIQWFSLRERAIADARRDTPHHDVAVYYYIELNHVRKSMDDNRPTIVNRVLPHIRTDYVSWSSYDVTKPAALMDEAEGRQRVLDALDYIEDHMPESDIPGKRVMIGEYGFELSSFKDVDLQRKYTAAIMKWALEWGCPFILYWELYCNEIDSRTGEHRGYWLIDDNGQKQPIWYFHREFLAKANRYVEDYQREHGTLPSQATYNRVAAEWIESFSSYDVRLKDHRIYGKGQRGGRAQ